MSLRARLFLFFTALVALLGAAEWWLVDTLTKDLSEERIESAVAVGGSIMSLVGAVPIGPESLPPGFPNQGLEGQGAWFLSSRENDLDALKTKLKQGDHSSLAGLESVPPELRDEFLAGLQNALEVISSMDPPPKIQPDWNGWSQFPSDVVISIGKTSGFLHGAEDPLVLEVMNAEHFPAFGQTAGDHSHPIKPKPLRVPLPIPQEGFDRALASFRTRLLLGTIAILGLGLSIAAFVTHRLSTPLRSLTIAAKQLEQGQLGTTIRNQGDRELDEVVTAFNRMSQRLKVLDEEAQSLREQAHLTELGEVARGLAHALRNPLHMLGLAVQSLDHPDLEKAHSKERLLSIRHQIERMDRALTTFLSLSTGGSGEREAVSLAALCQDLALETMQGASNTPKISVMTEGRIGEVHGVPAELRAVLHVLLVNAVEASASQDEIQVLLREVPDGSTIQLEVLDQGPGLSDELLNKLFTPHLTTKKHGAGVGLFLAKRIVQHRYGGEIQLQNRPEGGARAILRFPLHQPTKT
ncbi:MAG: sensor histidine kinase [Planctomycetota bacterium]|nr:MAG: sensor histidine kinase [Planctomycetota bacterium]